MPATDTADTARIFSGLSVEEQSILDAADAFARKELHPLASRMDDEEWWPPQAFPLIGGQGFLGVTAPAQLGGAGMDLLGTPAWRSSTSPQAGRPKQFLRVVAASVLSDQAMSRMLRARVTKRSTR